LAKKRGNISVTEHEGVQQRAIETEAKKSAKQHVADSLGHADITHVSAAINDDKAVKTAELDVDKLDELSASEFKEVAKTARTDAVEAKVQLDNIVEAKKSGDKTSAKLAKTDVSDYLKQ
jgi:hypothetical protein